MPIIESYLSALTSPYEAERAARLIGLVKTKDVKSDVDDFDGSDLEASDDAVETADLKEAAG